MEKIKKKYHCEWRMKLEKVGIKRYIKLYKIITLQYIKTRLEYRADFFISMFALLATDLVGILSFLIITGKFNHILKWGYYELLFLYGFTILVCNLEDLVFHNNWNLRNSIYSGEFIKYKFRPINPFFYFMSETVNLNDISQILFGMVLIVVSWIRLGLKFSLFIALNLLLKIITSVLTVSAILIIASASSFWIVNSIYIMILVNKFCDYARYPLGIYNKVVRVFFSLIIPIGFIAYYPSLDFLANEKAGVGTLLCPLAGICFFGLSYFVWMKGCNKYDGTGS